MPYHFAALPLYAHFVKNGNCGKMGRLSAIFQKSFISIADKKTMAIYHYINAAGERIEARGREIKKLAAEGTITPETIIEFPDGQKGLAINVTGLKFYEAQQSESSTVILPPPAGVNPFAVPIADQTASVPVTQEAGKSSWKITVAGSAAVLIVGMIGVVIIVAKSPSKPVAEVMEPVKRVVENDNVSEYALTPEIIRQFEELNRTIDGFTDKANKGEITTLEMEFKIAQAKMDFTSPLWHYSSLTVQDGQPASVLTFHVDGKPLSVYRFLDVEKEAD